MERSINPNADKDFIDQLDLSKDKVFPKFLKSVQFAPFRHIKDLTINFNHPISIIAGTNRSGKSTVLMALACSHFNFKKRNIHNGKLERQTWSSLMHFTNHDKQVQDWTYYITYKTGAKIERKRGQRKARTKKWNGIGKKESQITERQVTFIDLERILPARNFGKVIFNKAKKALTTKISISNVQRIENFVSYVLEEDFKLFKLADHLDKDVFKYTSINEYSSYNAATGEEVLIKIIIDTIEAPKDSLILIDEIEIGLHPKVQRRLIHVLYNIARNDNKQFIITSHSPSILSSLPDKARTFIEKQPNGDFKAIPNISVNASLSKMDSISYPLVDLYCEDEISEKVIIKAISFVQNQMGINNFKDLINIIKIGSADKAYLHFKAHQETYPLKKIQTGYACILDGDTKGLENKNRLPLFPPEDLLHFLYSYESPEKFLTRAFLKHNTNNTLDYHLNHSNPHCLFDKMVEVSLCTSKEEAFEVCWSAFLSGPEGGEYFKCLQNFLIGITKSFSSVL